ncbi:MAG: DedA family protein, partial [Nanoarchaeota archaeon]
MIITTLLQQLGEFFIRVIEMLGYPGIVLLMALESMIAPVPSELVMPFAGFLAGQGKLNFMLVIVFSSLGSLLGSLISYYIGKRGGYSLVKKFGKYLLLDETDLQKTQQWFEKRGEKTIFISRFIPVVRHLISIPAGVGRMDLKKFCLYTVLGATLWNGFLAYVGFVLGQRWEMVRQYTEPLSLAV